MPSSSSTLAFAMRDALVAKFNAAKVPGGKLAAVTSVHASSQLNLEAGPAVGVAIKGWSTPEPYRNRSSLIWVTLQIVVAARSVTADEKCANLDDAEAALVAVLDDNAGGGVIGVLNDRELFALPTPDSPQGLGFESRLGEAQFGSDLDSAPGAAEAVTAYCVVDYAVHGIVTF